MSRSQPQHVVIVHLPAYAAVSPCPPPPPPVFDPPECPRVVNVSVAGSRMWPTCLGGNCAFWGVSKLVDGRERSINSLGITHWATNPYVQLDLGTLRRDILTVRLVSRADTALQQSQNLNVYLSATTDFLGANSTLCEANVTFNGLGTEEIVLCPVNFNARYVTVLKNGTNYLSLQEVQPMVDSKYPL